MQILVLIQAVIKLVTLPIIYPSTYAHFAENALKRISYRSLLVATKIL